MSEATGEYPRVCQLCGEKIGSRGDLDWHGLGNCAPICDICSGSGIEDKTALAKHDAEVLSGTITVTEADARVAAMRQRCVEIIRAYCRAEQQTVVAIEAIEKLPANDAALRVIVAQAKLDGARGLSFYSGSTTTYLDALASELAAAEADLAKR